MCKITRETEIVWIYIKYTDSIEKLLEENDIHFKKVSVIELEEIDEPESLEELEVFRKRDSGELESEKIISFVDQITKH